MTLRGPPASGRGFPVRQRRGAHVAGWDRPSAHAPVRRPRVRGTRAGSVARKPAAELSALRGSPAQPHQIEKGLAHRRHCAERHDRLAVGQMRPRLRMQLVVVKHVRSFARSAALGSELQPCGEEIRMADDSWGSSPPGHQGCLLESYIQRLLRGGGSGLQAVPRQAAFRAGRHRQGRAPLLAVLV